MKSKELSESILVDDGAALRVEGIESWIETLVPVQDSNEQNEYDAVRLVDPKTGAMFAVTKLKSE